MADFYNGLGIVVGVLVGVIAGTCLTLLVQQFNQWRVERQWLGYFKYEINLNVKKIDGWLEELQRYRNAVNANNLAVYFGYFDFSRFLTVTAYHLLNSGLLYKHLTYQEIAKLQAASGDFSIFGESYMNTQVQQNRQFFVQTKAAQDLDFWQRKFDEHKQALQDIGTRLSE